MRTQLVLIEPAEGDWKLDDHTREIGREGLALARAALRAAHRPVLDGPDGHPDDQTRAA